LHLQEDAENFASESTIKTLVSKCSPFVSFPIMFLGNKLNEFDAVWLESSGVTRTTTLLYTGIATTHMTSRLTR